MTNDDRDFDDVAFTAGRGLASIGSTPPAMAAVRRRIAVRRASIMSSVAVLAVVSVIAVNAQRGSKPTVVDVAVSSTTSAPTVATTGPFETSTSRTAETTAKTPTTTAPLTTAPDTTVPGTTSPDTTAPAPLDITVAEPRSGAVVSAAGPLLVRGDALTFESVVNIKVFDANGDLVIETKTMAAAPNGVPGPYTISIDFPTPVAHLGTGRLEVFEYSAKDGTEVHKVTVPITYAIVS